jgi:signal transduction protein with GAF and PtsI domain
MLLGERERQLFHVASYGISEEYLQKRGIFVDDKYSAFSKAEPVFVADMQKDLGVQYPETAARELIVSMLSVPIQYREVVIGLIRICNNHSWALHEEDIDAFCVLVEHLGLVIENKGLKNSLERVKVVMESLPLRMFDGL